jgi:hypothetical protein
MALWFMTLGILSVIVTLAFVGVCGLLVHSHNWLTLGLFAWAYVATMWCHLLLSRSAKTILQDALDEFSSRTVRWIMTPITVISMVLVWPVSALEYSRWRARRYWRFDFLPLRKFYMAVHWYVWNVVLALIIGLVLDHLGLLQPVIIVTYLSVVTLLTVFRKWD